MRTARLMAWVTVAAVLAALPATSRAREPRVQRKAGVEVLDESFKTVVRPDSKVRRIADGFQFTEGPVWYEAEKCLLFSDIPADTIHKWTQAKGLEVWRKPSHNTNGNALDHQGRVVSCEHSGRQVSRTNKDGKVEILCSTYKGKRLNSPNDACVAKDGTIWFTDPPYGIKPDQSEQEANYVFRLDPGAKEPVAVASDFARPNGICLSPDGKILYVANSDRAVHHIRRFRIKADKTLEGGEVFCTIRPGGPDGIRCDCQGRLYSSAGDGVQVFSPEGKRIGRIVTPQSAANLAFGGPEFKTLFITARSTVWAVDLAVRGAK